MWATSEVVAGVAEAVDGLPETRAGTVDETETSSIAIDTGTIEVATVSATATAIETGATQEILGHVALLSAGQDRQHEISESESGKAPLGLTLTGLDVVREMEDPLARAPHHRILNSACHHTLPAEVASTVAAEGDVATGLPIVVVVEDRIWTIGATVTHAAGLRKAAGVGTETSEIGWIGWIDTEKWMPAATLETNAIPATVSCSGRRWRLAQTLLTILRPRTRKYRHLLLRHQHPPLDLFRTEL